MVAASAGSGLVVPLESWANPTTQTLPLEPDTFSPSGLTCVEIMGIVFSLFRMEMAGKIVYAGKSFGCPNQRRIAPCFPARYFVIIQPSSRKVQPKRNGAPA